LTKNPDAFRAAIDRMQAAHDALTENECPETIGEFLDASQALRREHAGIELWAKVRAVNMRSRWGRR